MPGSLPEGFQIDPELSKQYGATVAVNPATGQKMKWNDGGITPPGALPRPEYGHGAYETPDGAVMRAGKSGATQVLKGAKTVGADSLPRLMMGLGPAVEAQKNMYSEERWQAGKPSNPNDTVGGVVNNWLADGDPSHPIKNMIGKAVGGDRMQNYKQASSSFESAVLPILSGANITPTEASRIIKAALPEPGDSTHILAQKSKQRAMMINGAAKLLGEKPPFPRIPAMDLSTLGQSAPAHANPEGNVVTIDLNGRPVQ